MYKAQSENNDSSYISLADRSEDTINQLIALWIEAFGDDENFIRDFIDCYLIPEYNVPVIYVDDKIVSALYLVDFDLYSKTTYLGISAYLFAAATKVSQQNKGYMSKLVNYVLELYKNRGYEGIFLFPQDENTNLFNFYSKFGFKSVFNCRQINISNTHTESDTSEYFIVENLRIDNRETFDELYDLYALKTIKNAIVPLKDRQFYFKCAKSYVNDTGKESNDNNNNSGKYRSFFGIVKNVKNIEEKFCYIFYRISEISIQINDITLIDTKLNKENIDTNCVTDIILHALKNTFDSDIENKEIIFTLDEFNENESNEKIGECKSLAMMNPLSRKTTDITENIIKHKSSNYINMFMNC